MTTWERPSILHLQNAEAAQGHLEAYFAGTDYSGSFFESVGAGGDAPEVANRITSDDLVALAMLSVPVQGAAARNLLVGAAGDRISDILGAIPIEADLTTPEGRDLLLSDTALEAWKAVRDVRTFGPVRTSKLLARKRPRLIPIYDDHIRTQFGAPNDAHQWATWVSMFGDDALVDHLNALRAAAGIDERVSLLRILDVVVWMEGKHGSDRGERAAVVDADV